MKNYYDQQQELLNNELKLKFLKDKKQLYFNETQPKTVLPKAVVVKGSSHNDKLLEYVSKIEDIDKEILVLEKEIRMQKKYLNSIEIILKGMKGTLEEIFTLKYIDNLNVHEIARKTNYSEPRIYYFLSEIKKTIKKNKNNDV